MVGPVKRYLLPLETRCVKLTRRVSLGSKYLCTSRNKKVTASVCVCRNEDGKFIILSPCGVCQERLWFWGEAVEVAVPYDQNASDWKAIRLSELTPHYWRKPWMIGKDQRK